MNRTAIKDRTERPFERRRPPQHESESRTHPRRHIMNRKAWIIVGLALVLSLAACASPTPMLDEHFGDAVRAARLAQTLHPDAGRDADPVTGLDGIAAERSIDRYHASFRNPPPVTNVVNIGGTIGGGAGGGPATPAQ
jgi:hypothetical protein